MKLPIICNNEEHWLSLRLGKIGGTRISSIISQAKREMTEDEKSELKKVNPKSKSQLIADDTLLSKAAYNCLDEVIAEILTGQQKYTGFTHAMERGKELEPFAFSEFCRAMGFDINSPEILHFGVTVHGLYIENNYASSSPDFCVMFEEAIGEIKCEGSDKHVKYLRINTGQQLKELEPDHYEQLQYNMLLGEAKKGYFVSYDDRFKTEKLRIKIIEVFPDLELQYLFVKKLEASVKFLIKDLSKFN